jgi:hypothetical protein
LAPFFVVLSALALSSHNAILEKNKLVVFFLSIYVYVLFISIQVILFSNSMQEKEKRHPLHFLSSSLQNWTMLDERFKAGFQGTDTERTLEKINVLKSRHETLFSFLTKECRFLAESIKRPTITFYPWELMFAEAIEGCELKPSPNLQIYTVGPHTKIQHLEAEFLASEDRPNIVVIGSKSIDGRNSVSEYTDILPILFRNYEVVASIEDYVVLESTKAPIRRSDVIICSDNSQGVEGEFFRLKLESLASHYDVLWHIATLLFKSPELTVQVSAKNEKNENITFSFRGYLSQLKQGVYVSEDTVNMLIFKNFRQSLSVINPTQNQVSISRPVLSDLYIDASAVAVRNDGAWNLPVIPRFMPLQVQYCSFRKDNL